MTRIGVFAGTFDPIHNGHIGFALAAAQRAKLSRVYFLPEPRPRYKTHVSSVEDRLRMIQIATRDYDILAALKLEDNQFTLDRTWPELRRLFKNSQLVFLVGSDVASTMASWPGLKPLVIGLRSGADKTQLQKLFESLGYADQVSFMVAPAPSVTSSKLRAGADYKHLDQGVIDFITQNQLYK